MALIEIPRRRLARATRAGVWGWIGIAGGVHDRPKSGGDSEGRWSAAGHRGAWARIDGVEARAGFPAPA
ncbi:MAG: hypothetical protein MZV65_06135 [Chromatiales bacterium]|nr:hypothetical protein [Chromatiales bacterium]